MDTSSTEKTGVHTCQSASKERDTTVKGATEFTGGTRGADKSRQKNKSKREPRRTDLMEPVFGTHTLHHCCMLCLPLLLQHRDPQGIKCHLTHHIILITQGYCKITLEPNPEPKPVTVYCRVCIFYRHWITAVLLAQLE